MALLFDSGVGVHPAGGSAGASPLPDAGFAAGLEAARAAGFLLLFSDTVVLSADAGTEHSGAGPRDQGFPIATLVT
ncbi:hypothetical protein GCM10023171_14520 [Microbacterium panaciterrae]|uniref:LLM class flavin-dependent oxidoreductase n=1 Tax=Microbacterium panaciterrae TaxID=985759 RepID=A0ABP8P7T7_9MICO